MAEVSWQAFISSDALIGGVVGGVLHAGIAIGLWEYGGAYPFLEFLALNPLLGAYFVLGMVVLGFVSVVYYVGHEKTFPAILVGLSLLFVGLNTLVSGPPRPPFGGPTQIGLYHYLWVVTLALALLVGRIEPAPDH